MHADSIYYGTYLDTNNIRREMPDHLRIIGDWYRLSSGIITELVSIGAAEVVCRDIEAIGTVKSLRRTISLISWCSPGRVHHLPGA